MKMPKYLSSLFIISAASGTGKTSLARAVAAKLENIKISISCTTRPIRHSEIANQSYFFIANSEFERMIENDEFLEYAKVFGAYYGTPRDWVVEQLKQNHDVILDIDWQGAQKIRQKMAKDTVSIFLLPPSQLVLNQRLTGRNRDSAEIVAERLAKASSEISHYKEFDYLIINDNFETAVNDLTTIIRAHKLERLKQTLRHTELLTELLQGNAG